MRARIQKIIFFTAVVSCVVSFAFAQEKQSVLSEELRSRHFSLKTSHQDRFLSEAALEALEKAYQEIGTDLDYLPKEPILVEIHGTLQSFSERTTLPMDILEKSGTVGVCKFGRIMILSPRLLAYGYRWLDTLSHEYVHFVVEHASGGRAPLWVHEGLAKFLETRWRFRNPVFLTAGNRAELFQAARTQDLIPFSKMHPSLVYLDNPEKIRLAFSEVAHAIGTIQKLKGRNGIRKILRLLSRGEDLEDSFRLVLGVSMIEFETRWRDLLLREENKAGYGALPDQIKVGNPADELENLTNMDVQRMIRLGDRMVLAGQPEAASFEYKRALEREKYNPLALTRLAKILIQRNQTSEANRYLSDCVRENPNYQLAHMLMAEQLMAKNNWDEAGASLSEANAINPFLPRIHELLSTVYKNLNHAEKAEKERQIFLEFTVP